MKRNPWRRIALTAGAMATVLLLAASWRYLVSRGVFTSVEEKAPGACSTVAGVSDVTAMAVDQRASIAFITTRHGGLFAWHDGALVRMAGTPKDFHPLAASVVHPDGTAGGRLQVVFTHQGGPVISLFDVLPGKVSEIGRISTDVLTDPADLVSVDENRFYLVNRHATHTALGRWLDDMFLLPRAEVLYFDGMKFVTVAKGLNSPAGIALSPDAAHLYVSQDYPRTLVTFARNDFTGATNDATVLSIGSGLGKIHAAKDGSVIIAARPKKGMGQVWRVKDGAAELLYARRDGEIAAAAQLGRHLFIGGASGLMDCAF